MTPDVVVVGAGIVGAACAWHAVRAGLAVTVVDSRPIAGGTSGAGEGNLLTSDKIPGPELDLAMLSADRWRALAAELDPDVIEFDPKGGLVVADTPEGLAGLHQLAQQQAASGVTAQPVSSAALRGYEPHLTEDLAGGVAYPQDMQVNPMLATAHLLRDARRQGVEVRTGVDVLGVRRCGGGRLRGLSTTTGTIPTGAVVNAAGAWGGEVGRRLGTPVPVEPRRGFVLVTEPLPRVVRRKVYAADYVANVASSAAGLQTSPVIEGTQSGPVLIGSSRERVGFDRTLSVPVLRHLASHAVRLFPRLADVTIIRAYRGFRPYSPDHLPILGADPRVPGVHHACGHEGAGIGLSAGTGHLLAQILSRAEPDLDLSVFRPERFVEPVPEEVT